MGEAAFGALAPPISSLARLGLRGEAESPHAQILCPKAFYCGTQVAHCIEHQAFLEHLVQALGIQTILDKPLTLADVLQESRCSSRPLFWVGKRLEKVEECSLPDRFVVLCGQGA